MTNVQISLTEMRNESRVLKQAKTIQELKSVNHVLIYSLHENDLEKRVNYTSNITINRIPLFTRKNRLLKKLQILIYIEFAIRIFLDIYNKKIFSINIHSVLLLPLGYVLKKLKKTKLVYDTHELETETNGLGGKKKKVVKLIEQAFIGYSDHIFVVSENIADWYAEEYNMIRPTVVFNAPAFKKVESNNYFRNHFKLAKHQTIVLYQGFLVPGRGIEWLIEAFKQRDNDHYVLVFLGYGSLESHIRLEAKDNSLIYFHEAVKPEVLLNYTSSADIGVSLIQDISLSDYLCMPNKLFEYLMAGLPVIASNMKEMRDFVLTNEVGVVIEEETVEGINKVLDGYNKDDWADYKKNSVIVSEKYSWDQQAQKMTDVYSTKKFT